MTLMAAQTTNAAPSLLGAGLALYDAAPQENLFLVPSELLQANLLDGKPFAGFAFTDGLVDMYGREVNFAKWQPTAVMERTLKAIADYKARNMPGLPVDARAHDKGDAAGWLTGCELGTLTDSDGDQVQALFFTVQWTSLGSDLIRGKIQANFSPTVDLENKFVMGGSLTNWPASIDKNGVPLFPAIELSRQNKSSVGENTMLEMNEEVQEFIAAQVAAQLASAQQTKGEPDTEELDTEGTVVNLQALIDTLGLDLQGSENDVVSHYEQLAELAQKQAQMQFEKKMRTLATQNKNAELSQRVTGGTPEAPRGFPVDAEKLAIELNKLEGDQLKFWRDVLETAVTNGLTEFSELGHGKHSKQLQQVPEPYRSKLDDGSLSLSDLRNPIITADIGDLGNYDLSKWQ